LFRLGDHLRHSLSIGHIGWVGQPTATALLNPAHRFPDFSLSAGSDGDRHARLGERQRISTS
jgi:hypothetical protein